MKITEGVHRVEGVLGCHVYLVEGADSLTLVDTGLAGAAEKVLRAVAAIGRQPGDIRRIVITHCHGDHTGSLAALAELTGAQVCVHAGDAPVVRGDLPMPAMKASGLVAAIMRPLSERMAPPPAPWRVDRELQDGDELDGLRVVHTPGHTEGHIGLYMASKRVLFVGDAMFNVIRLRPPFGMFTVDMAQAKESIRKLAALDAEVACFGHGAPIRSGASARLRRFAEGLR